MPDLPEALAALAHEFEVASVTHAYVADAQRELIELGAADEPSASLLQASARIALSELPALLADLQTSARRWTEEELLDPSAAIHTLTTIEAELALRAGELRAIRERHRAIAAAIGDQRRRARASDG